MIPLNKRHVRSCWRSGFPITPLNDQVPRWVLDSPTTQPAKGTDRASFASTLTASLPARLGGLHHHYRLELIAA